MTIHDSPADTKFVRPLSHDEFDDPREVERAPARTCDPPIVMGPLEGPICDHAPAEVAGQGGPDSSRPPGGARIIHGPRGFNTEEVRSTIADAVKCIVWAIVRHDPRTSADWLEDIAEQVDVAAEDDRRGAKRKATERPKASAEETRQAIASQFHSGIAAAEQIQLERARDALRGIAARADAVLAKGPRDFEETWMRVRQIATEWPI